MENDISPHGYSSPLLPTTPQRQKLDAEKSRDEVLAQTPLLKKVIQHLSDRIDATDSVKQAITLADKYDISRENALVVLDIVRQQLETEKRWMEARITRAK